MAALDGVLDHEPFVPPLLIGGVVEQLPEAVAEESPGDFHRIVLTDSGPKIVPLQRPVKQEKCVIDYFSFTVHESVLRRISPESKPFTDEEYLMVWAQYCASALLRLRCKIKVNRGGMHGFSDSARVGEYATVGSGGEHSLLFVQFSGHAFACADAEFPQRLYQFIQASRSVNVTRIDIAYDDFAGETFRVRDFPAMWNRGEFNVHRSPRPPKLDLRGDWARDDVHSSGLTAYIGARESGKFLRGYEKGKHLGDKESPWVRVELELRGDVFMLVPEMLIRPTSFFIAAYPALVKVAYSGEVSRLHRIVKEGMQTVERVLDVIQTQYGAYLHVLRAEFFGKDDSSLLDRISRVPHEVPSVLQRAINLSDAAEVAGPSHSTMADKEHSV